MADKNSPTPAAGGDPAHLLRLLQFLAPYRWRVAGALVALVTAAGCVLALGQGLRFVIDAGFGSGNPAMLNMALAGVIAVATVLAVATYTRFYLMMTVGERVIADLRRAVFAHVLRLSPAFFDASRTGEIVSRLTNDSEQLRQVIGFGLSMFLRNGLMMIGALVLLFATSPKLAALIVLSIEWIARKRFDLVFANILMRPLIRLAPKLVAATAPGGTLILSGLLRSQVPLVRQAYASRGMVLTRQIPKEAWMTLVWKKP